MEIIKTADRIYIADNTKLLLILLDFNFILRRLSAHVESNNNTVKYIAKKMDYHVVCILYSQGKLRSTYDSYEVVVFLLHFSSVWLFHHQGQRS